MKIAIVGIGAVGGYFGGRLAAYYQNDKNIKIYFIARGGHLKEIQKSGLKIKQGAEIWRAHPTFATDQPSDIGVVDIIVLTTKTYHLESAVLQIKSCIGENTVLLPLLNGVDSKKIIHSILPNVTVWDGLVYIIARLTQPGEVENKGNVQKLFFGTDGATDDKMQRFYEILKAAELDAYLSENMASVIWDKYIFISSIATITSYFDNSIGEIMADEKKRQLLNDLLEEVMSIAVAKNIAFNPNVKEKAMARFAAIPFEATSSMHSDFRNKKPKNELEALTGDVVRAGKELGVEVPVFERMYEGMRKYD